MGNLVWKFEEIEDLYRNAPCGYHSLDEGGVFVHVNETELRWLGYDRDELVGKLKATELLTPDSRKIFEANFPRFKAAGSLHDLELDFLRKDGTVFSVLLSASAIRDQQGHYVRSRSVLFDITERKRAERKFRALLEAAPDAMIVINQAAEIVLVNGQLESVFGYDRAELLGNSIDVLIPEPARRHHAVHVTNYLAQPRVRSMGANLQLNGRRKDGSEFPVEISLSPLEAGEDKLACAAIRDVTDQRRMQDALRQSEERFRVALENSPIVVFNQDRELRYTWINSPVLGWAEQNYIGRTDAEIVPGKEGERLMAIKGGVLQSGLGTRAETTVTFNGEKHYFDLTVEPMWDDHKVIQGVTCAVTDITPMKQATAEREKLIEDLANTQRELTVRNLELETLNKEKARWLGMATHDLRNPLSAIVANCQMLAEVASEDQRGILESIDFASRFMLQLLDDVLDISAIESGNQRFFAELAHLPSLIDESIALCRPLADRKGTEITPLYQDSPLVITLDLRKMRQVLVNLIGNAIKYSQMGAKVQVEVVAENSDVSITVSDDGPGIPPDELDSIFTPFFMTRARAASAEPGTGLGLAISKRIVERHGGRIWAENRPSGGAAFHVFLSQASV